MTNLITGKSYIGKTIDLPARLRKHKSENNCIYLHRAIQKYGIENFKTDVLDESDDEDNAYKIEERMILEHKTLKPYGYNLLIRDGTHRKLGKDSLKKLARSLQGRSDLDKKNSVFFCYPVCHFFMNYFFKNLDGFSVFIIFVSLRHH